MQTMESTEPTQPVPLVRQASILQSMQQMKKYKPNQMIQPEQSSTRPSINLLHQSTCMSSQTTNLMQQTSRILGQRRGCYEGENLEFQQNQLQKAQQVVEDVHISTSGVTSAPNVNKTEEGRQKIDKQQYSPSQQSTFQDTNIERIIGQHLKVFGDNFPHRSFTTCCFYNFSVNFSPNVNRPLEILAFQERLSGSECDGTVLFTHAKLNPGMPPIRNSDKTLVVLSVKFTPEFYKSHLKFEIYNTILVHCLTHLNLKIAGRYFCYPDVQNIMTVEFDVYRNQVSPKRQINNAWPARVNNEFRNPTYNRSNPNPLSCNCSPLI